MAGKEQAFGQGMISGGAAGSAGGPIGAGIGAGVGGLMGYLGAEAQEKEQARAHKKNQEALRQRNRYSIFYGERPEMQTERARGSSMGALAGGLVQGAQMGGQIGNMYAQQDQIQQPQANAQGYYPADSFQGKRQLRMEQNPYQANVTPSPFER